jgi:hypothetical protein
VGVSVVVCVCVDVGVAVWVPVGVKVGVDDSGGVKPKTWISARPMFWPSEATLSTVNRTLVTVRGGMMFTVSPGGPSSGSWPTGTLGPSLKVSVPELICSMRLTRS